MDVNTLGIFVTILGITGLGVLAFNFAPKLQGIIDEQTGAGDDASQKSLRPLYEVFYLFSHSSAAEWIHWIKSQDPDTKDTALNQLTNYLDKPAFELGVVTGEVIRAFAEINFANSYDILSKLLVNCRGELGSQKAIDTFYETLCASLIRLDSKKAFKTLKAELDLICDKETTLEHQIDLVKALGTVSDADESFIELMVGIAMNRSYKLPVRKQVVHQIKHKPDSVKRSVYQKFLGNILDNVEVLSVENIEILKELFNNFKTLITSYDHDVWNITLRACSTEITQEIFIILVSNLVASPLEKLDPLQLQDLQEVPEPALASFKEALHKRFALSDTEIALCKTRLQEEDLVNEAAVIRVEKSKRTKSIALELLGAYHGIEKMIHQDGSQSNKVERKNNQSISVLTGDADFEKIYLLRGLAANLNRSFVYVDLNQMISNNIELNKIISTISNSKPAIVYVDNLYPVLIDDLDEERTAGLKSFNKSLKELSILPNVTFFGNLSFNQETISADKPLHKVLISPFKGSYKMVFEIEKPALKDKQILFKDMLDKLQPGRVDETFLIETLVEKCQEMSLIEYLIYLAKFFEKNLLTYGGIGAAADFPAIIAKQSKIVESSEEQELASEELALSETETVQQAA